MNLAAKVVENPEILATLGEVEIRGVLGTLTMVAAAAHAKWLVLETERASKQIAQGDRLLGTEELRQRLGGLSVWTLQRRAKAGKYPFMFKDGGVWVGSEDGLERWIAARGKRQSHS